MTAEVLPFAQPLPPARRAPVVLRLGTRVTARPPHDHPGTGTIWAVTRKARPVYDVSLDDGRYLRDLPGDCLEPAP